jgi:hypothetical protein
MARMTRRALLRTACGSYALMAGGLLAACGNGEMRPTKSAGRPVGAVSQAASPTIPTTPPFIIYPPLPTIDATVILPTAVQPPNHQTPAPKPTPANVVPWTPVPTPRPEDPRCVTGTSDKFVNPKLDTMWSSKVIIATVSAIFPTRWSTPDGLRPANPHDTQATWLIYTPVEVQVEQAFKGAVAPALLIAAQSGTIGEDCVRNDDGRNDFTRVGERVVLFLDQPRYAPQHLNGTPLWWLVERYTVTPEGNAINSADTRPLADLVAEITAAASTPASPLPATPGTPAPSSGP